MPTAESYVAQSEKHPRKSKRRRRIRSPHPGVVLIKPDPAGRHPHWRARYDDPDLGRRVKVRIDPLVASREETRREWAIHKARALAKRRDAIKNGEPRATGKAFAEAVGEYFTAHPHLRPKTLRAYRDAADKLVEWARKHGMHTTDDVTRGKLVVFRTSLVVEQKRVAEPKGRRGQRRTTSKPRSPHSVNRELRSVRTVLGYLLERDLLIRVTTDELGRALKRLEATHELVEYLRPASLQELLGAAMRHDADTFDETRKEHVGLGTPGTTPKYEPIAPFVATVLLTGMRFGEAIELDWAQVDLEALDHDGRKAGEIRLAGAATKTHRARTIGLEVSPALRAVLAAMRLKNRTGKVFALSRGTAEAAAKRLLAEYGAPKAFGWQVLRQTCGTYLTNAPGIFGAASAYRSAKQLGHSVTVAEKHYVDLARGIPREARTLEAAMQIEAQLAELLKRVSEPAPTSIAVRLRGFRGRIPHKAVH